MLSGARSETDRFFSRGIHFKSLKEVLWGIIQVYSYADIARMHGRLGIQYLLSLVQFPRVN